MAKKKKPQGSGKPKRPKAGPPAGLPDPRAMEEAMRQLLAGIDGDPGPADDTPLGRAQELVYDAFEEPDPKRRAELAREALKLSPDCADAHVLLAEVAPTRKEALAHYEQGVAAGERAIGPETFREAAGHFWGLLETRPYMRARLGLAHLLWTSARRDEAVAHLRDMLRLNPNDNQGVRYTLAGFLLFLDRDDDLAALLAQYPDDGSAAWAYTAALLAFRKHGDTDDSRKLLKEAVKVNRHVPAYLTGQKYPPSAQPEYYSPGDESEALEYLGGFLAGWKFTPGAVAWVRANTTKPKPPPKAKGPTPTVKKALGKVARRDAVWQADFRQFPDWMRIGGEPVRPWAILVTSRTDDLALAHQMTEDRPAADVLWDTVAEAVRKPVTGKAHRPATLQVLADPVWEGLRPHLTELGVALEIVPALDHLERVYTLLTEHLGGERRPGLLEMPGMTPERVGGFYAAAAGFFRDAPWKKVGYEAAIKVECGKFQSGPWYAVLMGQSGLTAGVALYEDVAVLQRMWGRGDSEEADEENARETVGVSVTFGEEWDTPAADLEAARKHGWPVARPDAYPEVFRKDRGLATRPPLAWELELVEGCLRAVPEFVRRRRQDDTTREEITVPTAAGPLTLGLAWVDDENLPPGP